MQLIFSKKHKIALDKLGTLAFEETLLYNNSFGIVSGLDFDAKNNEVYWSDGRINEKFIYLKYILINIIIKTMYFL